MEKETIQLIKDECYGKVCQSCIFYNSKNDTPCCFISNDKISVPSGTRIEQFNEMFEYDTKEIKKKLIYLRLKNL